MLTQTMLRAIMHLIQVLIRALSPAAQHQYLDDLQARITQSLAWVASEPNGEALWANVRQSVEDILFNEWRNGSLQGTKPEDAFFARCDRSTMTQADIDNHHLVCLVGVAVVQPTEFTLFRVEKTTAA